jgi:hypothetical protein
LLLLHGSSLLLFELFEILSKFLIVGGQLDSFLDVSDGLREVLEVIVSSGLQIVGLSVSRVDLECLGQVGDGQPETFGVVGGDRHVDQECFLEGLGISVLLLHLVDMLQSRVVEHLAHVELLRFELQVALFLLLLGCFEELLIRELALFSIVDGYKFNVEDQVGIGTDGSTGALFSIGVLALDKEFSYLTKVHGFDTDVPSLDH